MAEYIDKWQAVANLMDAGLRDTAAAVDAIQFMPAADVRPVVRGKWRGIGKTGRIFVCPACDKTFPYKTSYCPNCGADMREES